MSSLQSLREFISERLAAAAEEIFRQFEGTIVQYEQELCRQRRLLDICWKPQLQLHHTVLPQHYVSGKEDLCDQRRKSRVDPESPQIEETQEEQESPQIEGMQEEPEPPQIKEEEEDPELPKMMEEEGFFISQYEKQLDLKQEMYTSMEAPTYEQSETDLNNQHSFNITSSQDEEESQHQESSSSTTDEETESQNKDHRKRRIRSRVRNIESSHMSESQCDSEKTLRELISERGLCLVKNVVKVLVKHLISKHT
ncbi:troponin T, fast skeletal muscle [Oryzias melastigma]|uniref:troponin T, fast skeletal muscle n=1 Tax=Oryzias melastigma TaxID=30732 RepID=UPI000CF7DD8D|nr:troponin T, fast skeletal muscle [Oryzias melastigma]